MAKNLSQNKKSIGCRQERILCAVCAICADCTVCAIFAGCACCAVCVYICAVCVDVCAFCVVCAFCAIYSFPTYKQREILCRLCRVCPNMCRLCLCWHIKCATIVLNVSCCLLVVPFWVSSRGANLNKQPRTYGFISLFWSNVLSNK